MADFLEERFTELVRYGASYNDDFAVKITKTSGGQEYRALVHQYPVRTFDVSCLLNAEDTFRYLLGIYHRAHGKYAGFRARCADEFSSNGRIGTPTPFDHPMALVSAGIYQLRKYYGTDKAAGSAGYAYRDIYKPVAGTVRVGVANVEIRANDWTLDDTTGKVTFDADLSRSISSISKAANAVITLSGGPHTYEIGQAVHISGVVGMTQINGLRALITAIGEFTITVAINSTAFSTYTSGGTLHTRPQGGESVTAGFEFDFPVRFNSSLPIGIDYPNHRSVDGVELIELLNP